MPVASTRVSDDFYERIKDEATDRDLSVSDFIRQAIEAAVDEGLQTEDKPKDTASQQTLALLISELEKKNAQIDQLHQLMAMDKQERERLAQQLNRAHLQLEDLRKPRRWWRFWRQ
jgi:predicted CopG family antitoxin